MNPRTSLRLALIASLGTLSLAACGGGSSGLGTADLTKQLDQICLRTNDQMEALKLPSDLAGFGEYSTKTLKVSQEGLAALKAIKAADSADAASLTNMIAAIEESNGIIAKAAAAADKGDESAIKPLMEQQGTVMAGFGKAADRLGSEECAAVGTGAAASAAPATTDAAPTTTAPAVTVPVTTPPTEPPGTTPAATIPTINIGDLMDAPAGYDVAEVDPTIIAKFASSVAAVPAAQEYIGAVSAGTAVRDGRSNLVLGVQLTRELNDAELEDFLGGVVEDSTAKQVTTLGGVNGVAFQDGDGSVGFAAVIGRLSFIAFSENEDELVALVEALAAANRPTSAGTITGVTIDSLITLPDWTTNQPFTPEETNDLAGVLASRPDVVAHVSQVGGVRVNDGTSTHWIVALELPKGSTMDEAAGQTFVNALIGDPEAGTPAWEFATIAGIDGVSYIDAEGLPTFIMPGAGNVALWMSSRDSAQLEALVATMSTLNPAA